jgi:hypothetical protein
MVEPVLVDRSVEPQLLESLMLSSAARATASAVIPNSR